MKKSVAILFIILMICGIKTYSADADSSPPLELVPIEEKSQLEVLKELERVNGSIKYNYHSNQNQGSTPVPVPAPQQQVQPKNEKPVEVKPVQAQPVQPQVSPPQSVPVKPTPPKPTLPKSTSPKSTSPKSMATKKPIVPQPVESKPIDKIQNESKIESNPKVKSQVKSANEQQDSSNLNSQETNLNTNLKNQTSSKNKLENKKNLDLQENVDLQKVPEEDESPSKKILEFNPITDFSQEPKDQNEDEIKNETKIDKTIRKIKGKNYDSYILWENPELVQFFLIKGVGFSKVILGGVTVPGTLFSLKGKDIDIETAKQDFSSDNETGRFQVELLLPAGQTTVFFQFLFPNNKFKKVPINLNIQKNRIVVESQLASDPVLRINKSSVWVAAGFNYTSLKQTRNDVSKPYEFSSLEIPSLYIEGKYASSKFLKYLVSYKYTPGKILYTNKLLVENPKYTWNIFSLDSIHSRKDWTKSIFGFKSYLGLRLGLNNQSMPLLIQSDSNVAKIVYTHSNYLTAGIHVDVLLNSNLNFEFFMKNQFLINSQGAKISNNFSFDGSVGLLYGLNKQYAIGFYWYGQYQKYNYKVYESYNKSDLSGTQNLLYSNMEARFVYSF